MFERFAHADVGIMQLHVFSHQRHFDGRFWPADVLDQFLPLRPFGCHARFQSEALEDQVAHFRVF